MKRLTNAEAEVNDWARKNPKEFYTGIIDTLLEAHDEDKITVLTLLSVAMAYVNGVEFDEEETAKNKIVVESVLRDYGIKDITDISKMIYDYAERLEFRKLNSVDQMGTIQ